MNYTELNGELTSQLKEAMKAKDVQKLGTIRMIKAALTTAEKVDPSKEIDWMKVLQAEAKKRLQSADAYKEAGLIDRQEQELYERGIIESFLPQKMSEEETSLKLKEISTEMGFASQKDMGKLIKEFQNRYAGKQDGGTISKLSKTILS